jgi:hypothetical protein
LKSHSPASVYPRRGVLLFLRAFAIKLPPADAGRQNKFSSFPNKLVVLLIN